MPAPTVHSNAFNFLSAVQAGVDPRTGQYNCSISLPELKANHLCGPIVPLKLGFSPMSSRDVGFGKGWSLQLSHYDPVTKILSLSTGETFRIQGTATQPTVPERKIDSFHFFIESDKRYRVVHKSGLVEILTVEAGDPLAWVSEVHSIEGHRVSLGYVQLSGTRVLQSVRDDYGTLLSIDRGSSLKIEVNLHPGMGPGGVPLAKFILGLNNREVTSITLPTANNAGWRLLYESIHEYLCIKALETPLGAHELITYDSQYHEFPNNLYPGLPRVSHHEQRPGLNQPPIHTGYNYSNANFLGYGAVGLVWDDDGLDNLYQAQPTYSYSGNEILYVGDQPLRTTTRTFNHFHLLTEESVTQNDNVLRTRTTYPYRTGASFPQQPAQCQLPDTVTKTWYLKSASSQTHEEITQTTFDDFGNLMLQINPDGTREASRYYPATCAEDDEDCPTDPQGFTRNLRDKTITPAEGAPGAAPVLRTAYQYAQQTGVGGGSTPPWLAISAEILQQVERDGQPNESVTELQRTAFTYINQPTDRYLHGRKLKETQTLNAHSTITDYHYVKTRNERAGETVQHTLVSLSTDFDDVEKSYTLQHSLLNGQPLLNRDDNDVEIAYRYDALGRVLEETVAPNDAQFKASRTYEYTLSSRLGQAAEQIATNVKGLKTRTVLDGANRVVEEYRQGADENKPADYVKTYNATYNNCGLLVQDTVHDWLLTSPEEEGQPPTLKDLALTSTYEYDDWGEQSRVTGPDGVTKHKVGDPIKRTTTEWMTGSGKTITLNNLFEKPDSVERQTATGQRISLESTVYDGLGRAFGQFDALGNYRQFSYDAFDRMLTNALPGGALVERSYALHSKEDLPTSIKVDGVVLGEQAFDGLDRMTSSTTGGRLSTFDFVAGQLQPSKVHTPSGEAIDYVYQPQLGDQPIQRKTLSATADYTYDRQNARLLTSKEQDQELERDYYGNGEVKEERRVQGGQRYAMQYRYSLEARLLSYTDVLGATQKYVYDDAGRLEQTDVGSLVSNFTYNALGQLESTETIDNADNRSLKISLEYDDAGREVLRRFSLPGGVEQTLEQAYDAADHLQTRILKEGASVLRDESFEYDPRGRLEVYTASGPQAPVDPQGKQIMGQRFTFDALDNILEVETAFAGGSNTATYEFANQDPTQLSAVRNTHDDYPAEILLRYDDDGNLITDEAGRLLDYDALGRLISVSLEEDSDAVNYGYDAQDSLTSASGVDASEQRFYRDGEPVNQLDGQNQHSFIRAGDALLAERQGEEGAALRLLVTDAKKTVLVEVDSTSTKDLGYTSYGHQSADALAARALAFNGELREYATGWYLLGQGYRAYNPVLMRFHSPDSLSPFGGGGVNAYAYCLGDPVNYRDPDGHLPAWAMTLGGLIGGVAIGFLTAGIATPIAAGLISAGVMSASTASALGAVAGGATVVMGVASLTTGVIAQFAQLDEGTGSMLGMVSMGLGLAAGVTGGVSAGLLKSSRAAIVDDLMVSGSGRKTSAWGEFSDSATPRTSRGSFKDALERLDDTDTSSGREMFHGKGRVKLHNGARNNQSTAKTGAMRANERRSIAVFKKRPEAGAVARQIAKKHKVVRRQGWDFYE